MENIEIVDRYSATGTPRPGADACDWCEGMGVSPIRKNAANTTAVKEGANGRLIIIGQHEGDGARTPTEEDEFLFVRCPRCFGTRKAGTSNEQKIEMLCKDFGL